MVHHLTKEVSMNIKSFMAVAVVALTLAACDEPANVTPVPGGGASGTEVELDDGRTHPRQLSEENPAHRPN